MTNITIVGKINGEPRHETSSAGLNYAIIYVEDLEDNDKNRGGNVYRICMFSKLAEMVANTVHDNDRVAIIGHIRANNFTKDTGEVKYNAELVADRVSILSAF